MNAVGKVTNGKFEEFANTRKGGSQDLNELAGRVATAEEDIDALETNVAQIDDVITAQGTAINNLDTRTTQQGESITSAKEILAQHGVALDDLAEKVADILLHKISADKVLTAESESAYADDTFLMSGKKTASLIAQLNGNIKKQDICKAVAELSSSGWYRIATKTSGDTDINAFGGYGESGIIIISRIFSYGNNESYVILFNSSYNKHVVFRCVGASVNLQLIDKLRISLTSAQSLNIELHYNSSNINQVSVTAIYNQCDKKWSSVNLTQVTETVSDVAVYNIPTEDDVTKLTYDIVYPISVEVPERSNLATVPFRTE